jgi:hypothetical protein
MPALDVAAYYFPQWHTDPRNDAWHGPGWTEWRLLEAARPRFPGHGQPIVPAWGHGDESDPVWAAREIDLAADHAVTTFLYDYYWYDDAPFLSGQLDRGFLRAPNRERIKLALMWANHDWQDIHPATLANRPATLARGATSRESLLRFVDHAIATYFREPNYLTIDGCPYLQIYELGTFVSGLGGLDAAAKAVAEVRARVRAAGFPDIHLAGSVFGVQLLPSEQPMPSQIRADAIERLGLASMTSYTWVHHIDWRAIGFPRGSYAEAARMNYAAWDQLRAQLPVPYQPNVSMGWDPSPRTTQTDGYVNAGYPFTAILEGNTPEAFRAALERAKAFAIAGGDPHPMVTINAWNEWTEGSYLLPDTVNGTAYLEQVRDVFGAR